MVKKHKIFGNTLDNLVKFAEEELKRENNAIANANSSNIDAKKNSTKKKPMSSRYVVKHVPPEIQEFVQYFTKHEGIIYNNSFSPMYIHFVLIFIYIYFYNITKQNFINNNKINK